MPTPAQRPDQRALDLAAAELQGPLIRTSASVIGHRGGESVIFAVATWGFTVTVVMKGMRIGFTAQPRGWLRKTLHVEGSPIELVNQVFDDFHQQRLLALQPIVVELAPAALRIDHRYGGPTDVADTLHLAVSLARRARSVEEAAPLRGDDHFARTA